MVVKPHAKEDVMKNAQKHVQIVAIAIAIMDVLQHVLMLVKPKHRNIALTVRATVLLDAQPPVLMLARHRHRKAVLIVLHNVVEIVSMNVLMAAGDNVIRRVVVNAKGNVADHAR